jgi:hypothetical protein
MNAGDLYEAIDVWERGPDNQLVRYRCFRNLSSGKYSVQSADFYRTPFANGDVSIDHRYLELLMEQSPDLRSGAFDTLQAAIYAHRKEFG